MNGPQTHWLEDGRRLHLNHGPIDLIVQAFGDEREVAAAYAQAQARFSTVLVELVDELPQLRQPASAQCRNFSGSTARRMEAATSRFSDRYITPMAAVAGSVADEVLAAMVAGRTLSKAYVNDGGDIALFLSRGQEMLAAIAGTGHGFADRVTIRADDPVRGIATSGWRGRSFSLGIADTVTVLASDGATADVAATLIANAVDLPAHLAIQRAPANHLSPDTDLGGLMVTTGVGALTASEVNDALGRGRAVAEEFVERGLIVSAALFLCGESRLCNFPHLVGALHRPSITEAMHV